MGKGCDQQLCCQHPGVLAGKGQMGNGLWMEKEWLHQMHDWRASPESDNGDYSMFGCCQCQPCVCGLFKLSSTW